MPPRTQKNQTPAIQPDAERRARAMVATLRLGATAFSALAGLACYALLVELLHANTVVAVILGLIFALLTRVATLALARDWLAHAAAEARHSEREPR